MIKTKKAKANAGTAGTKSATTTVFVYGSLMRGLQNHCVLGTSRFLGVAKTLPRYAIYSLGSFPAMTAGKTAVKGELYEVDAAMLERLDTLEGNGRLYQRTEIELSSEDAAKYGFSFAAGYIFLLTDDELFKTKKPIASGDWRAEYAKISKTNYWDQE